MIRTKPEMIIFDYGNTLVEEDAIFEVSTFDKIYQSIYENPQNITKDQVYKSFRDLEARVSKDYHDRNLEFRYEDVFRYLFSDLALKSRMDYETISEVYFDSYAPARPMDTAGELLDYLDENNIRYGVISNLSYSSAILKRRLARLFERDFEFVLTTCEWMYKKPHGHIFNIGQKMANLPKEKIWYLGDNPLNDVKGAMDAGLIPVYFDTDTQNHFIKDHENIEIEDDCIRIEKLRDLIQVIEKLKD